MTSATRAALSQEDLFSKYVVPELDVLMRVARSITGNPTDADDLVQDTLIRAYKAIERFDGRHPRAWLLTIMRNAQINRVRRKRPSLLHDPDATMATVANTQSDSRTPEDQMVDMTFDESIERSFAKLSDSFKQAVTLVDIQGLSYAETAAALDIPVGTVMSRLHRGRKQIREGLALEGEYDRLRP